MGGIHTRWIITPMTDEHVSGDWSVDQSIRVAMGHEFGTTTTDAAISTGKARPEPLPTFVGASLSHLGPECCITTDICMPAGWRTEPAGTALSDTPDLHRECSAAVFADAWNVIGCGRLGLHGETPSLCLAPDVSALRGRSSSQVYHVPLLRTTVAVTVYRLYSIMMPAQEPRDVDASGAMAYPT